MSKVVRMPNGDLVRFGDEFDDAEIRALILNKFPDAGSPAAPKDAAPALEDAQRRSVLNNIPMFGPAISGVMDALGGSAAKYDMTAEEEASGDWRRGTLAPVVTNATTKEMRLAWPQLLKDAADAFMLPGEVLSGETPFDPRWSYADQDPATLDRAAVLASLTGTTLPMAAKGMLPASARDMVTAGGTRLPQMVADDLERSGIKPEDVNTRMAEIGPSAMIGDLSTNLQGRMAAIANLPGRGQEKIMAALMARKAGANDRIKASVGDTLGEAPVPRRVEDVVNANKKMAAEGYEPVFREKALSDNFAMDAAPIAAAIDEVIPSVVGKTRERIVSVRAMLIDPRTGEFTQDPRIIKAVREELDGMITAETNPTTQMHLGDLRKAIDQDLGAAVPGLKSVDAQYREQALQQEAFDYGKTALRNDKGAIPPEEFADEIAKGTNPPGEFIGPSAQPIRIQQGMIADIAKIVGTTANDRVAMKAILKGEGSWNREKLVTAFGETKAKKLIDLFDAEALMQTTEDLALAGSKSARLLASQEGIRPGAGEKSVIRSLLNMDFADAALGAGDKLTFGALKGVREGRNLKIAEALLGGGGLRLQGRAAKNIPGLVNNPVIEAALIDALLNRDRKKIDFSGVSQ